MQFMSFNGKLLLIRDVCLRYIVLGCFPVTISEDFADALLLHLAFLAPFSHVFLGITYVDTVALILTLFTKIYHIIFLLYILTR